MSADGGLTGGHLSDPGKEARAETGIPVIPAFDGYRAFAILAVVLLHIASVAGVSAVGQTGIASRLIWGSFGHAVEILFVVSGFVVFLPTVARQGSFGGVLSFAIRRGARLLPAYWMILLVSLVVIAVFDPGFSELPNLRDTVLNFTGTMVPVGLFVDGIPLGFGLNQPLWTLSVELCFYVVLPLVAAIYFRHPLAGLITAGLITIGWTLAFDHVDKLTHLLGMSPGFGELVRLKLSAALQIPTWAYSFGLGMTGAWVWVRLSRSPVPWAGKAAAVSGAALLVLVWILGGKFDQTRESLVLSLLFSTAITSFMVTLSLAPPRWQIPVAAPAVRRLGDISYGIYLSHMVLVVTLASEISMPHDGGIRSFLIWFIAVLPASILYGYLSARFLEQPIRRWARRYGRRDEG
jgi:peptidoglycan/LPS O-acetylase OafA/YrhL